MLDITKELQAISSNTDRYDKIKQEIDKIDNKIDETIYKLYGLTTEEIRKIEK